NNRVIDLRPIDFGTGQEPRPRKDWGGHIEEIELGQFRHEVQVRFEEIADGSDVFPITLEDEGEKFVRVDRAGNDVFAEISEGVVQKLQQDIAVKHVNTHG